MANLVQNPGAEDAVLAPWVDVGFSGFATVVAAPSPVYDGTYSFKLRATWGIALGDRFGRMAQTLIGHTIGETYPVVLWINPDEAHSSGVLEIELDRLGTGAYTTIATVRASDLASGWQLWAAGSVTPESVNSAIRISSTKVAGSLLGAGNWHVDSIVVGAVEVAARANVVRDALSTKIQLVANVGTYVDHDVVPKDLEDFPTTALVYLQERKPATSTLPLGRRQGTLVFAVRHWTKTEDTGDSDAIEFAAGLEAELETLDSENRFIGISWVRRVLVIRNQLADMPIELRRTDVRQIVSVVEVDYRHDRGNPFE